jgi:hypothetical protein
MLPPPSIVPHLPSQEYPGNVALEGRGGNQSLVVVQELMQKGGAATVVADDENGGMKDGDLGAEK